MIETPAHAAPEAPRDDPQPQGMDAVRALIPLAVRRALYALYVLAGVAVGALTVAYDVTPHWLDVTTRVLAYLATPVGALALVNAVPVQAQGTPSAPTAGPESPLPEGTPVEQIRPIRRRGA